jgi:hypothetical protein
MNPTQFIDRRQRFWALRHGIPFDNQGYVVELNDNLFMPLSPGAIQEYQRGGGGELKKKIRALHSSAALVVNTFDYWRRIGKLNPILEFVRPDLVGQLVHSVRFEAKLSIKWPDKKSGLVCPPS